MPTSPGRQFFAARGSLAGRIELGKNVEFSDAELDDLLDDLLDMRLLLDTHVLPRP